ncbi:hypothetical protein Ssi03_74390 [Sphaerisporangium siamense]|uniref:Uncharacterized protein n=1 Tax=Sphaerisporangium siamense TaxID=795645 RepID=A0A7W7DB14_9ACTN|nr:hypothetical protein [Sphaerisporangium siamense]MBB4702291.1 hypothetical protein [Sphaerisporangium siamense]GII89449.1 hypothetical protein Ssi03_74390 [Sphaerisporangium siamense]
MTSERRLADLIIEHPAIDLLFSAALVGLHLFVVLKFHHGDVIGWMAQDDRKDLYTTGATVIAIIFGFASAAVAHYSSAQGDRARTAKRTFGKTLRNQWLGTLALPMLAALACLVAMALDGNKSGELVAARWIFEAAVCLAAVKVLRVLYLFQIMLDMTDLDAVDQGRVPAPAIKPGWLDRHAS